MQRASTIAQERNALAKRLAEVTQNRDYWRTKAIDVLDDYGRLVAAQKRCLHIPDGMVVQSVTFVRPGTPA
jgi:hypothetical protein